MGIESSDEMANFFGMQYLIYRDIETIDDQLKSFSAVTKEQVKEMADKLKQDNLYLYYIQ
jgi:predicted Zn-dependent peptidase